MIPQASRIFAAIILSTTLVASATQIDQKLPLRFGLLDIERESTYLSHNDRIQQETVRWLRETLPQYDFEVRTLTIPKLAEEIKAGRIDAFLSSSGFFVEMWPYGVRDIATLVSRTFPDPNRCVGGAIIVRSDREELNEIADLKGLRAVSTNPQNFMAFQLGMSEIAFRGYDPRTFFQSVSFTRNEPEEVLRALAQGTADVGLLRACFLESITSRENQWRGAFKVIEPVKTSAACGYSTKLYPGWTVAVTSRAAAFMAADLSRTLLAKAPAGKDGYHWEIATDYRPVNEVFRLLRIGPYEYLNHWTLERFWEEYKTYVLIGLLFLAGWVFHWLSVEVLVRRRTAELQVALQAQRELHAKAMVSAAALEKLTKFGVVNELSAIYAHELAQPLTSIGYLVRTLRNALKRLPPDSDAKPLMEKCAEKINVDLGTAQAILSRVRRYAKAPLRRDEAVDFTSLVSGVVSNMRKTSPVAFEANLEGNTVIRGDKLELSVLTLNLLRNAAEHTSDGRVRISLRREETSGQGRMAVLEVRNAGTPPVECAPGVFEDRSALRHSDANGESSKGFGLGLLIVRSVLKAHGGTLHCFAEGDDVVFRAEFPQRTFEAESER